MKFDTLEEITDRLDEFLWPDADERLRLKRRRILEAARDLMVQFGYRKTSMDEVARQAGVAKGTVYLYYSTKAELVFHAIALEERAYLGRLEPLLTLAPAERLRGFICISFGMIKEMPLLSRITGGDREIELALREIDAPILSQVSDLQTEFMIWLLEEAVAGNWSREALAVRARVLVDLLFAITTGTAFIRDGLSAQDYGEQVADIIVHGILHPPEGESAVGLRPAQTAGAQQEMN
jgi:AcrR family transcriptional regulator